MRGKKAKQLRRELFDVVISKQVADRMQGKSFRTGIQITRDIKKEYTETPRNDRHGFVDDKISGKKS